MAKFDDQIRPAEGPDSARYVRFSCPGCKRLHMIPVTGPKAWGFNGDLEKPTLTPSILATLEGPTWKAICHSFVTDGRIQFLGDCTHALSGQTVDLPEWPGQDEALKRHWQEEDETDASA
jgi:hypothetical protein